MDSDAALLQRCEIWLLDENLRRGERLVNKVILMGRLTRDPDIRYTQGQDSMCIARYTLAVDRHKSKDAKGQQADFISCVAFGKCGEFLQKYCSKGTKLTVTGRIQTGSYTRQDGQKVYTTVVVTDEHEFAESKNCAGANESSGRTAGQQAEGGDTYDSGFEDIPEGFSDNLPFT